MDREKVIEAFDEAKELVWIDDDEYTVGYNNGLEAGKDIALALLKEQQREITLMKVAHGDQGEIVGELIRCKDCWKRQYDNCPFREWVDVFPEDDFFCADGERKEGR